MILAAAWAHLMSVPNFWAAGMSACDDLAKSARARDVADVADVA